MMKIMKLISILTLGLISFGVNATLLSNSGFESGLIDWQSSGNAAIRTADPLAYEGQNYIYGSSTPLFSIWQDVDLLNNGFLATQIDTGNLVVEFGGWQSGWNTQTDNGQISLSFFDVSMSEIGGNSLPSFFSNHTWVEKSGSMNLLSGTRFIRYEFVGTRTGGSNNDAYLDSTFLNVTSVPVPTSVWLFGSGLVGLVGMRKKTINSLNDPELG